LSRKRKDRIQSVSAGFTTLELVIALLVLSIIIMVTASSILEHRADKSRKQISQRMEEVAAWMREQRKLQASYADLLPMDWSSEEAGGEYRITLARAPVKAHDPNNEFPGLGADTFTLQAESEALKDCGYFLLDQSGRRGVTGPSASVADCWP